MAKKGKTKGPISAEMLRARPDLLVGSPAFEAIAQDVVYNQPSLKPDCEFKHLGTLITYDTATLITRVEVSVLVKPADFPTLTRALDPRNWPRIGPEFFPFAYKVEEDAGGQTKFDGDTPRLDLAFQDKYPRGGINWEGCFYEVFRFNWNETAVSEFRNLLHVDYAMNAAAETVTMTFWLSRCLESTMWFDRLRGGIDVDEGETRAEPWDPVSKGRRDRYSTGLRSGWWKVTGSKRLRFTDRTDTNIGMERPFDLGQALNYLTPALVAMFLEVAVKEGSCVKIV